MTNPYSSPRFSEEEAVWAVVEDSRLDWLECTLLALLLLLTAVVLAGAASEHYGYRLAVNPITRSIGWQHDDAGGSHKTD